VHAIGAAIRQMPRQSRPSGPNVIWGTDAPRFDTDRDGWCWFLAAINQASDDIGRWHAAKVADRWAALEPTHHGMRTVFGIFGKDVARGPTVRSDWGPQYVADAYRNELAWLASPAAPRSSASPSAMASWSGSFARSRSSACGCTGSPRSRRRGPRSRLHRALQPRVVDRTTRASDTGSGPQRPARGGGVT